MRLMRTESERVARACVYCLYVLRECACTCSVCVYHASCGARVRMRALHTRVCLTRSRTRHGAKKSKNPETFSNPFKP